MEEPAEGDRSFRNRPEFVVGVPHSAGDAFDEGQKSLIEWEGDFDGVGTVVGEDESNHARDYSIVWGIEKREIQNSKRKIQNPPPFILPLKGGGNFWENSGEILGGEFDS